MGKGFLPNRNNQKHPVSQVTVDFVRDVYGGGTFNGLISLDMRDINGSFRHIASVECSNLEQYVSLMAVYKKYHYYISANSFTTIRRGMDTLFSLHNIVIDIDLHDERLLPQELEEKLESLIWRLENDCFVQTDIPIPNYIVVTGRGVQLWWCLIPTSANQFSDDASKISRFFTAVLEDFLSEFPFELMGFRVDTTASANLAGVYRLPGSVNPKCNREVEAIQLHSNRLDLRGFWFRCLSTSETASSIQKNRNLFRPYGRSANFENIAERRIEAICQLRDMRSAPVGEETRNDYCFAFFATLSPVTGTDEAYRRTLEFNRGFLQPLTEKELKSSLVSAFQKDYKFTTRRLMEFLNVTDDEASAVGLQAVAPRPSKSTVKRKKAARNEQIIALYKSGHTQAGISNELGLSRQTVSTVIRSSAADKLSQVRVLRQEGRSTSEIAALLGCSIRTVQRYLKKFPQNTSSAIQKDISSESDKMSTNPYIYGCTLGATVERESGAVFPVPDMLGSPKSRYSTAVLTKLMPYVSQTRYAELLNLWNSSPDAFDGIDTYKPNFSGSLTFRENDVLADVEKTSPVRREAAILSCLRDMETRSGDLFVDGRNITDRVNSFLRHHACPIWQQEQLGRSDVLNTLDSLQRKGLVVQDHNDSGDDCYFLQDSYLCEKEAAVFLAGLIAAHPKLSLPLDAVNSAIHQYENSVELVFSSEQAQAIRTVLGNAVSIITGGPGTGKTTLLAALCAVIHILAPGAKIRTCAPTGKAAVRLARSVGLPTGTIHSLLGSKPHKINCDFLIVDEASMIDIRLFHSLLKSIRKSTRIVFCGDPDQLPCVGCGDVLNAMISSGKIPVATLNQIHRQTEGSGIVRLAHQIKSGNLPQSLDTTAFLPDDIMFVRSEDEDAIKKSVLDIVASLLTAGTNANDIQILAATNDWCNALNSQLKLILNPAAVSGNSLKGYAKGDRVLFLENDYALKLHNGEVGIVLAASDRHLEISFGGNTVIYRKKNLGKLSLAYAMTIHKAQGSEYPVVIIPVHQSMGQALTRNLIYTGLTRAKKKCILIGSEKTFRSALRRTDSHRSLLTERLAGLLP